MSRPASPPCSILKARDHGQRGERVNSKTGPTVERAVLHIHLPADRFDATAETSRLSEVSAWRVLSRMTRFGWLGAGSCACQVGLVAAGACRGRLGSRGEPSTLGLAADGLQGARRMVAQRWRLKRRAPRRSIPGSFVKKWMPTSNNHVLQF